MSAQSNPDTIIIGAGIIGIAIAANLVESGEKVTVIDRTGICEETSSGNAAAFAFSDVLPLAQNGVIAHVPKWLIDPLGPLSVPPAYLPRLLPWLYRFWRAGATERRESSLTAQASLMKLAESEWKGLMDRSGTSRMLREDGSLELYESEAEFRASMPGWAARQRFGIGFRHLAGDELGAFQPGLAENFICGTFVPGWKTVADPKDLGKAVWRYAETKGAAFLKGDVASVSAEGDVVVVRLRHDRVIHARRLVVAAGAWSHLLARCFGEKIPLETERGYNSTLPKDAFDVRLQLIFPGHGFLITPLADGVRVGGAIEFGGLHRPPNYARSRAMLVKAARFLPGLDMSGASQWMGYRPSLPDSLPVIGRSANCPNVFYAFGHGHLGLTQAAATGRLMRDLIVGQAPPLDMTPFNAARF